MSPRVPAIDEGLHHYVGLQVVRVFRHRGGPANQKKGGSRDEGATIRPKYGGFNRAITRELTGIYKPKKIACVLGMGNIFPKSVDEPGNRGLGFPNSLGKLPKSPHFGIFTHSSTLVKAGVGNRNLDQTGSSDPAKWRAVIHLTAKS